MRRDRSLIAADFRHPVSADVADHIDSVRRRLEIAVGDEPELAERMRLAVLLHEEAPERVPALLEREGLGSVAPLVTAVIAAFGRLWKLGSDNEAVDYVRAHGAYLGPLLLFELVHEGAPASWMRRIAVLGGLEGRFEAWVRRLESGAVVLLPGAAGAILISTRRGARVRSRATRSCARSHTSTISASSRRSWIRRSM